MVDFVQVLNLFAPLVLLAQVVHVAFHLLFSLLDALFNFSGLVSRLLFLHPLDLTETLLDGHLVMPCNRFFDQILRQTAHLLHFCDLLSVVLDHLLLSLLFFLSLNNCLLSSQLESLTRLLLLRF